MSNQTNSIQFTDDSVDDRVAIAISVSGCQFENETKCKTIKNKQQ